MIGTKVDSSSNDRSGTSGGRPHAEVSSSLVGIGVREHSCRLGYIKQGIGKPSNHLDISQYPVSYNELGA